MNTLRDINPGGVPPLAHMGSYILLTRNQAAGMLNLKLTRYCTECHCYHQVAPMSEIQEYYPSILKQGRIKNWYECDAEPDNAQAVHVEAHDNRQEWKGVG